MALVTTSQSNAKELEKANVSTVRLDIVVKKRNGQLVPFFETRILNAIESACKVHLDIPLEAALDTESKFKMQEVSDRIVDWCQKLAQKNHGVIFIEDIQDQVIRQLREDGFGKIADRYAIYRRTQERKRFELECINIQKRDGRTVSFKPEKIAIAIGKAFQVVRGEEALSASDQKAILDLTDEVVDIVRPKDGSVRTVHIENIQDIVETRLMMNNYHEVARRYIIYREERRRVRQQQTVQIEAIKDDKDYLQKEILYIDLQGQKKKINFEQLRLAIREVTSGLEDQVSVDNLLKRTIHNCYQEIKEMEIRDAILMAARSLVEEEPSYSNVAARILLKNIYEEVSGERGVTLEGMKSFYPSTFKESLKLAVSHDRLDPRLLEFDLDCLGKALKSERDLKFQYLGLQILYDRYFIHQDGRRLETPQSFWMRIAMGLSLNEGEQKNLKAIEFYDVLSQFLFVSSTPTLFNSGTLHPQLSSCFLTTIGDDLDHIFKCVKDNAMLSKWSGGIGNDWTPVRSLGAYIKGTNGHSQGIIPFLKVANDTAVAVNQGGKRQGAVCAYLEMWHFDIEDFLDLKKNTGDDRRRTHDMHTAAWVSDLFMKRVLTNGQWSLFSPNEAPDLHDLYGARFEERYMHYEKLGQEGKLRQYRNISAVELWRKTLGMLFETGHPWITFKDAPNIRSPQDHVGVIHSTNLCTEIFLNTSHEETAVCNLGSINLSAHTTPAGLDAELLGSTVKTAIRMLDNVIDINFYPTIEAQTANKRHRPVGLGLMGFQDALYIQGIGFESQRAVEFADESMEYIAYNAILASSELAKEKGRYSSFKGSKWDRGLLPQDTIALLEEERGGYLQVDRSSQLDWTPVRESIRKYGMRNSNTMAIAPTATIANIVGVTQSNEPTFKNIFVKSNLSGEFTTSNQYLVEELKALGLWDQQMIDDLKYFDGSLQEIERIPQYVKNLFPTAFEISYEWVIECASRRQKWIDMGQSLNLFLKEPSGKKLHSMYMFAWERGLKSTYYLRCLSATSVEKSTLDVNKYGNAIGQSKKTKMVEEDKPKVCSINPNATGECEVCQ